MRLCVGHSTAREETAAVAEALEQARGAAEAPGGPPVFALLFATSHYDADRLAEAASHALGALAWAGCSTAGVIVGRELVLHGLGLGLFCGEALDASVGVGGPVRPHPWESGHSAAVQALDGLPADAGRRHRAFIALPEAVGGNAGDVVRGAVEEGGTQPCWVGGGTGHNLRAEHSFQFARGKAWRGDAVLVALEAASPFGTGIAHGWQPYGPPVMVTRACGNAVYELDYAPAFEVYRETARARGAEVTAERFVEFATMHPLGIPQVFGGHLIRDPLVLAADGSIHCVGEIPEGCLVQLMEGRRGRLVLAAADAASEARRRVGPGRLTGALVFDCVSRLLALDGDLSHELSNISEALGVSTPLLGCLSLGEVGGVRGGPPQFHNKTTVVLTTTE